MISLVRKIIDLCSLFYTDSVGEHQADKNGTSQ